MHGLTIKEHKRVEEQEAHEEERKEGSTHRVDEWAEARAVLTSSLLTSVDSAQLRCLPEGAVGGPSEGRGGKKEEEGE